MAKLNGYIAFDNAGGATLICGRYAHFYDNGQQLASDVLAIICGASPCRDWDGNDLDLYKAMRKGDLDGYDKVLTFDAIRGTLAEPSSVEIDGDEVSVDNKSISGYTLSLFWRSISAN